MRAAHSLPTSGYPRPAGADPEMDDDEVEDFLRAQIAAREQREQQEARRRAELAAEDDHARQRQVALEAEMRKNKHAQDSRGNVLWVQKVTPRKPSPAMEVGFRVSQSPREAQPAQQAPARPPRGPVPPKRGSLSSTQHPVFTPFEHRSGPSPEMRMADGVSVGPCRLERYVGQLDRKLPDLTQHAAKTATSAPRLPSLPAAEAEGARSSTPTARYGAPVSRTKTEAFNASIVKDQNWGYQHQSSPQQTKGCTPAVPPTAHNWRLKYEAVGYMRPRHRRPTALKGRFGEEHGQYSVRCGVPRDMLDWGMDLREQRKRSGGTIVAKGGLAQL